MTFAPGDTSEPVTVQTIDDALTEGDETFNVNLSSPTGNAAILDGLGVGTIPANDQEPQRQISINNVAVTEGNSGTTAATFAVTLDASSANPVTVDFATANGTATAPGDYASATGTVTFAPGQTSQPVTVQVNGDTAVEPNETFNVSHPRCLRPIRGTVSPGELPRCAGTDPSPATSRHRHRDVQDCSTVA